MLSLESLVGRITDSRKGSGPITTRLVVQAVLVMYLTRMGTLNALEETKEERPEWRKLVGDDLPSADSIGRITSLMKPDDVRVSLAELYSLLKRNKALPPTIAGMMALVLDGHETHATYNRKCSGCLERRVKTKKGVRIQYYHRNVTAMLLGGHFPILLDAEPQKPGEDEVATALRLLKRVLDNYPRAFDVVLGDSLYTDPRFYNFLVSRGKEVLTVLKKNQPGILEDAEGLFSLMAPANLPERPGECLAWDSSGFASWPQVASSIRVIRTRETTVTRKQLTGELEETTSEWYWVTTLSTISASTATAVFFGHARWDIENQGFNEAVSRWNADHVCKHHENAILLFWLLAMLAFNIFFTFFFRNLKPAYRSRHSYLHIARRICACLHYDPPPRIARPP